MMTKQSTQQVKIALIGNPNAGKTSLFNALTGSRQRVGNWPGVTVDKKVGYFSESHYDYSVVDLPGSYNLAATQDETSIDEKIATDFLFEESVDAVINVVDASHLERNLYLTTQLLELGVPVVVALNMHDLAARKGIHIDVQQLQQQLRCPVIPVVANKKQGIAELKQSLGKVCSASKSPFLHYPQALEQAIEALSKQLPSSLSHSMRRYLAIHLLEDDANVQDKVSQPVLNQTRYWQNKIEQDYDDPDIVIADKRYQTINEVIDTAVQTSPNFQQNVTQVIDKIVLNRFVGVPIFLLVMYTMFLFAINVGGIFQDFFDISTQTIFIDGLSHLLHSWHWPEWSVALLASGVGKGINTAVTFIPVIGGMFLFLSALEASGYMARAAFVVDRLMRALGLPGKSFVPMIVGFGCNVPAIMAARTLESRKDRVLTVLMAPFMSCGARLAIYSVFVAAFFPHGGQDVVFSLYLIGIGMAVLTGFILRKTLLQGPTSPLVMEMPPYHLPSMTNVLIQTWHRLKRFLFRAGKLIIPICVLIGALNAMSFESGSLVNAHTTGNPSILAYVGQLLTPLFHPMGITQNNWPATVGLMTGVLAKEVVVGTLNTLYAQSAHIQQAAGASFSLWGGLQHALMSIPHNLQHFAESLKNPIMGSAEDAHMSGGSLGAMYGAFGSGVAAYAYLLFVLLYFPCVSATAAAVRELNRAWGIFTVAWNTGIAYGVATCFYQAATWLQHPLSSSIWLIALVGAFLSVIFVMRLYAEQDNNTDSVPSYTATTTEVGS